MNLTCPSTHPPQRSALRGKACVAIIGGQGREATGVALQADPVGGGFHLVIVAGTRALMALGPYSEEDVAAEWRKLGAATGLPLLVRLSNGSTLTLMAKIGPVHLGTVPACRKASTATRRPRFLAGRSQGRLAAEGFMRN